MACIMVKCPSCSENDVIKFGKNATGTQRYRCKNNNCGKDTFLLKYARQGDLPEVKQKIITMTMNGSGVRDISRVLKVSVNTVISELKKKEKYISAVNYKLASQKSSETKIDLVGVVA